MSVLPGPLITRRQSLFSMAGALGAPYGRKAPVAFHYAALFERSELSWYHRFQVLVTGGILSPEQTKALRAGGGKLVAYEWTSAFYPGDEVSAAPGWQRAVLAKKSQWLLNTEPVSGGAAEAGKGAYWYDFGDSGLVRERAAHLAGQLQSAGYDGIFFDTPGLEQLPAAIQASFRERHPGKDYNQCQGDLIGQLRKLIGPGKIIFLNQGYRHKEALLPAADYDLSESYFTLTRAGETVFRPWHDERLPWEAIRTPMEQLIQPAAAAFPAVRFVHLNYAAGDAQTVRRAIGYSYAAAKMFGHESYLVAPAARQEEDEVYFADLGRAKTAQYVAHGSGAAVWREFERGVVGLNSSRRAVRIPGMDVMIEAGPGGYTIQTA